MGRYDRWGMGDGMTLWWCGMLGCCRDLEKKGGIGEVRIREGDYDGERYRGRGTR